MRRPDPITAIVVGTLLLSAAINIALVILTRDRPSTKPEPYTWCEKRLLGYLLISQELNLYNDGSGELKCRYSRGDLKSEPSPARK